MAAAQTGQRALTINESDLIYRIVQVDERHFLMRVEVAEFRIAVPLTGEVGTITLRSNPRHDDQPLRFKTAPATPEIEALGEQIAGDSALANAIRALDAKKVVIKTGREGSEARIRMIGFSRVVMAFPPTKRYIASGPEQVAALRTALAALSLLG